MNQRQLAHAILDALLDKAAIDHPDLGDINIAIEALEVNDAGTEETFTSWHAEMVTYTDGEAHIETAWRRIQVYRGFDDEDGGRDGEIIRDDNTTDVSEEFEINV